MNSKSAARRPRISMIDSEAELLSNLALSAAARQPRVCELLLEEIDRAHLCPPEAIGRRVVTLGALVDFVDGATGRGHIVELVLPEQADITMGRVSILTPVGSGLIGLSEGQSILWPDVDGRERRLTIVRVSPPARLH